MAIEIGAKITTDTTQATQSINQLNTSLKAAKAEMNAAKIGSNEYVTAQKKVKDATDQLNKSNGDGADAFGMLKDKIFATVPGLKAAETGTTSFGKQLWALAANPVVLILTAIVVSLKFLYEAFTYTVAGGKKMEQVMAGVSAAISVVVDRVMLAGGAIIKFFSGDFKAAAKDMAGAFSDVGDAVKKAYGEVSKATEELQKLKKQERESSVQRAAQNAAIVKSKELLNDENATISQKKQALKEVSDFERKIGKEDVEIAEKKLAANKVIWGQTKEGLKKHAQEIADLDIEISGKKEETARKEIQLQRQQRTLNKQDAADAKQAAADAKAAAKIIDDAKKEKIEKLRSYTNKVEKLQEEEHLIGIKDAFMKEKEMLAIKEADDLREAKLDLENNKITKEQYADIELKTKSLHIAKLKALEDKKREDDDKKQLDDHKKELEKQVSGDILLMKSEVASLKQKKALSYAVELDYFNKIRALERTKLVENKASESELAAFDNQTATDKLIMADGNAKAEIEISKKTKEAKLSEMQMVLDGINAFADLAGRNTAVGKALAIASTTISTYAAAQKAFEAQQTVPDPSSIVRGQIAAGIAIVGGLARLKGIVSVPIPGQGSGGSASISNTSNSAPLSPTVQRTTTTLTASALSSINASASRAFVVESDVTNSQQRISRINRAARLG